MLRCCHRDAGMLSPHPSPLWGHLGRGGGLPTSIAPLPHHHCAYARCHLGSFFPVTVQLKAACGVVQAVGGGGALSEPPAQWGPSSGPLTPLPVPIVRARAMPTLRAGRICGGGAVGAAGLAPGLEGVGGKKGGQPGLSPPPPARGMWGHGAALCISEHPWAERALLGAAVFCLGTPVGGSSTTCGPPRMCGPIGLAAHNGPRVGYAECHRQAPGHAWLCLGGAKGSGGPVVGTA